MQYNKILKQTNDCTQQQFNKIVYLYIKSVMTTK